MKSYPRDNLVTRYVNRVIFAARVGETIPFHIRVLLALGF